MKLRRPRALVLCYHRVRTEEDPLNLSVQPLRFREQMERLTSLADVVPASEIMDRGRRPRVAITFDDGYADNFETAAPILVDAGAPATFFFTSFAIDGTGEFWWELLDHLVLEAEPTTQHLELDLGGRSIRVDVASDSDRRRAHAFLNEHLITCDPDEQQRILADVQLQTGGRTDPCDAHRKITEQQVRELVAHEGFELGGHTISHPVLAKLDRSQQEQEISGNRERMSALAGYPVTAFAYPYGHAAAFDQVAVEAARSAGYERAYTTSPRRVTRWTDALRIPRHVVFDWDGDEFVARISSWLSG